jgi:carboxypeptidase family protein
MTLGRGGLLKSRIDSAGLILEIVLDFFLFEAEWSGAGYIHFAALLPGEIPLCYVLDVLARKIPVLFGISLLLCPAQAQKQNAHLTIQVNDMSGAVISKAHVEILDVSTTFTKKLEANDEGILAIDLPFGTYEVTASSPAFKTEKKRIDVQDTRQTVTFMLNVEGGSTVEVVPLPSGSEPTYASLPDELRDESNVPSKFCSPCAGVEQQTKATAHIVIEVHDPTGAPIATAHVEISVSAKDVKKLDADDNGKLSIDLPVGVYEVTASFPAFSAAKKRIEVQDARNQIVTFILNVAVSGPNVEALDVPRFSGPMPMPSKDPEKPPYEVTITASRRATVGSEVKLHIITKNISDKAIYLVRLGSPPGRGLEISVRDSKGNPVQESTTGRMIPGMDQNRESDNTFTQRYPIQPGDRVEEDLNVGAEYEFSKPGTYLIQVLRSDILTEEEINAHLSPQGIKSNTVTTVIR